MVYKEICFLILQKKKKVPFVKTVEDLAHLSYFDPKQPIDLLNLKDILSLNQNLLDLNLEYVFFYFLLLYISHFQNDSPFKNKHD